MNSTSWRRLVAREETGVANVQAHGTVRVATRAWRRTMGAYCVRVRASSEHPGPSAPKSAWYFHVFFTVSSQRVAIFLRERP